MSLHETAEILNCTVHELKQRISYREFSDWILYLDGKTRRREKFEFYFAELIMMLGLFHGVDLDIDDVLIDWDNEQNETAPDPVSLGYAMARSFGAVILEDNGNGKK